MRASLTGRTAEAVRLIASSLPEGWPGEEMQRHLQLRLDQISSDPGSAEWLLRGMFRKADGAMVGIINFHGPPDAAGRAELGYTVFEEHRRQGYASEAAAAMMAWARTESGVRTFVVSISPLNRPSLAMAKKLGFRRVGTQIDEIDGEEWVFHLDA